MDFITVAATGVNIATSGTSASATIPNALSGQIPRYVRVSASAAAYIRIGKTTATAVTTDMMVQPGDAVVIHIPNGIDKIATIQVAAAGVVQVSPLENM
jgi:hypothetical protein